MNKIPKQLASYQTEQAPHKADKYIQSNIFGTYRCGRYFSTHGRLLLSFAVVELLIVLCYDIPQNNPF